MVDQKALSEIVSTATELKKVAHNEDLLYLKLNNTKDNLANLKYLNQNNPGPVNRLRSVVAEMLIQGAEVTKQFVDEYKVKITKEENKQVFKNYENPFSIFYPFFQEGNYDREIKFLKSLSRELINSLGLKDKVKSHEVDFQGSRNLGKEHIWLALYNKSHPNQKTALQLFVRIGADGVYCSLYDRPLDKHIQSTHFSVDIFNSTFVSEFFQNYKREILRDEFDLSPKRDNPKQVFKVSHGFWNGKQEYEEFLKQQIVVVHVDTSAKGRKSTSQGRDFVEANIGDVFYLCRGNEEIVLAGIFTSEASPCSYNDIGNEGWLQRSYKVIKDATKNNGYLGERNAWWLPNHNSTFVSIPRRSYPTANKEIFEPYFGISIPYIDSVRTGVEIYTSSFQTYDRSVKPILDVQLISEHFSNLICNLEDNTGQMLGVFGSWGRGKTFFVEQLCKNLKIDFRTEEEEIEGEFYFLKFHAWKYQDTEGVWAYLYEQVANKYFSHKIRQNWKYPNKHPLVFVPLNSIIVPIYDKIQNLWLRLKLNNRRHGKKLLIASSLWGIVLLLVLYAGYVYASSNTSNAISIYFSWFLAFLSSIFAVVPFSKFMAQIKQLGENGKKIVSKYTNRPSFNELLGVQAEIQAELKHLLAAWMESEFVYDEKRETYIEKLKPSQKRLLLFVDDIDRCHETRLIQVVDALRVMLEDEVISKRVIVLSAVDERILSRAIQHKYRGIEELESDKLDKEILVREYIDKLFIGAVKLAPLTDSEKSAILENYAKESDMLEPVQSLENEEQEGETEESTIVIENIIRDDSRVETETNVEDDLKNREIVEAEKHLLTRRELKMLQENFESLNITPRQLRILLYRYLLAKNIAQGYIGESGELPESWCEFVIKEIANKKKDYNSGLDLEKLKEIENSQLQNFTPKLIDVIVPY